MKELEFAVKDGTMLYVKNEVESDSKAIVLIVHDLCEHQGRYDSLAKFMIERNYGVYRYDHRGHGKSAGERFALKDFNLLLDDLNEIVEFIKSEFPKKELFLLGHSMGGFTVAGYGTKYPNKVSGIITSGALTRENANFEANIPTELPDDMYLPNNLSDIICTDTSVVESYKNDPLVGKEVSVSLFRRLFDGVRWLKKNPETFVEPCLILHGANDMLILEKDSRDFYGDVASKDKQLIIYPNLYHEIFNEKIKNDIYQDVFNWIEKRVK